MAQKRNESFTVTDRRQFTSDGQLRKDVPEQEAAAVVTVAAPDPKTDPTQETAAPPGPSAAEQQKQADAYRQSSADMDREVELGGQSAKDFEISFERFLASLYMTGMMQLGVMNEQGATPQLDLIGARQTIDSLSLLSEKTKGNLTSTEQTFLQNALYELRMAYVEVTNAIAKGPQQVPAAK
jgi:hypothetical protein